MHLSHLQRIESLRESLALMLAMPFEAWWHKFIPWADAERQLLANLSAHHQRQVDNSARSFQEFGHD